MPHRGSASSRGSGRGRGRGQSRRRYHDDSGNSTFYRTSPKCSDKDASQMTAQGSYDDRWESSSRLGDGLADLAHFSDESEVLEQKFSWLEEDIGTASPTNTSKMFYVDEVGDQNLGKRAVKPKIKEYISTLPHRQSAQRGQEDSESETSNQAKRSESSSEPGDFTLVDASPSTGFVSDFDEEELEDSVKDKTNHAYYDLGKGSDCWFAENEELLRQAETKYLISCASSEDDDSEHGDDYESSLESESESASDTDAFAQSDSDDVFAAIAKDYELFQGTSSVHGLDWELDEAAARLLLQQRRSSIRFKSTLCDEYTPLDIESPKYRGMQARLKRLQLNAKRSEGKLAGGKGKGKGKAQMKKEAKHAPKPNVNFRQLNRELKIFMNDASEASLELDPMEPPIRKIVHELAHLYGLKSKSVGSGMHRFIVLYKIENSRPPRDLRKLDRFLDKAENVARHASSSSADQKAGNKQSTRNSHSKPGPSARAAPGTVVGATASPIDEENLGNQLLRKMGWSPGQGLGPQLHGRLEPVEAMVRGRRQGLGHAE